MKRKVLISHWDTHKNKLKGLSGETRLINTYLEQVHSKLFECYRKLQNENKLISSRIIKAHFLGTNENRYALSDIIEYHNEYMKDTLRWGTQKNYFTTHKYLFLFLKQKLNTTDVYLSELSYKFIIDFECFLRHQKSMGNNTVMKHIERLRKMANLAFKMEWIDKDPFIKFKAKYIKKERAFLTTDELNSIEQKEFSISRLELIKDLFVFSCYTGLSYGDVMSLTDDNICIGIDRKQWIYSQRRKTSIPVKIPLLSKALEIIEKYKLHPLLLIKKDCFLLFLIKS